MKKIKKTKNGKMKKWENEQMGNIKTHKNEKTKTWKNGKMEK